MATMKDIARIAQVSTSTVSHVINGSRFVSDDIRAKVLKVVTDLHYTPSALARSFKTRETKTIGMLVTASNNPFFAEVVQSVEHYCYQHHYNLILSNTAGEPDRLQRNLTTLMQKQVDGLLLMAADTHLGLDSTFTQQLHIPTVIMDWWASDLAADKIHEDSQHGGYLATKTLLEHGHREIAIITGNLRKSLAYNRLQGYLRALQEAQITPNPHWIIESHFNFAGGLRGMETLLRHPQRPTAVFTSSDAIALGAYQALWRAGLRIPQDISIIGYDNIELAHYLSPPLSTIEQPKAELGKLAVETLLKRIQQPNLPYQEITLTPSLCLRESILQK